MKEKRSLTRNLLGNKKRNFLVATQMTNAIVALVSGKLIAEFIMPDQFGLYNLQFAAFTFFFSLLVGPSITFIKASYQKLLPEIGYRPFISITAGLSLLLFLSLALFFTVYKSGEYSSWQLLLVFLVLIPLNIISAILMDQFNVLDKINRFSTLSILKSIAGLIFLISVFYFIPQFTIDNLLLWGMQIAIGLIGAFLFLRKIKIFKNEIPINFKSFLKKHWAFTAPLMFLAIWSWINNYFDRYVIEAYLGLREVGIYNANYSLGSKFFSMLNPIFLVLLTPIIYRDNPLNLKKATISKYGNLYFVMGCFLLAGIYFTTDYIGLILLSENYSEGFYIIFWIAMCFLILTATFLYETIFYATHKTKIILYSNISSAVINMILGLLLIPVFGMDGAIAAMLASVFIRFGFIYFKFKNL
ncbi:oligosaccharide flippase family protein [Christiangramia sabulilitoris]|uniref:Oligosaccharide flippase family protein n=1 Tax=Christiangramia sabulilitoris TaxID=2583991 RepID=A0A550HZX2_9FLAO|nr:oligosaccharide flippase family protein [Christiangramia sabulilitoris]TRO64274.1 oligosaccharide flippase family protein [Christiangramia sabulilitoris]